MANPPFIVGISGGSGSGKTLFLTRLMEAFSPGEISLLSLDNYYKPLPEQPLDTHGMANFDLPQSLDKERFTRDLQRLKNGKDVTLREYTFNNDKKTPETLHILPAPIIIVEGIFTFYFSDIRKLLDLRLYIEAPDYLMLTCRITRDARERGYDLHDVLYRFQHHVAPSFKKYIEPLKNDADLIIPNHDDFAQALKMVMVYLKDVLSHK